MNPLQKVSQSFENGMIPESSYELIQKRFPLVSDGIARIEKASSIKYPICLRRAINYYFWKYKFS